MKVAVAHVVFDSRGERSPIEVRPLPLPPLHKHTHILLPKMQESPVDAATAAAVPTTDAEGDANNLRRRGGSLTKRQEQSAEDDGGSGGNVESLREALSDMTVGDGEEGAGTAGGRSGGSATMMAAATVAGGAKGKTSEEKIGSPVGLEVVGWDEGLALKIG